MAYFGRWVLTWSFIEKAKTQEIKTHLEQRRTRNYYSGYHTSQNHPTPHPQSRRTRTLKPYCLQIGAGNVNITGASPGDFTSPLASGTEFSVIFTGVYGDLPLLTARPASRAVVFPLKDGHHPPREHAQAFTCSSDAAGGHLIVSLRPGGVRGSATVIVGDNLDHFQGAVSSTVSNVNSLLVKQKCTVCWRELTYMTLHDVRIEGHLGVIVGWLCGTTNLLPLETGSSPLQPQFIFLFVASFGFEYVRWVSVCSLPDKYVFIHTDVEPWQ